MSGTERNSGGPWLHRAARAARDRLHSKPLVVQRRLVYEFDLHGPMPVVVAHLPLRFEIQPDPAQDSGSPGKEGPFELLFRAVTGANEAYRMRIGLRREELLRLLTACKVPPRPVFLYDCFTEPAYRGQGVYPAALAHALRFAKERGYDKAYIRVEQSNVPSILGIERAGFKPAAIVVHAALFGVPVGPFGRTATWAAATASRSQRSPG